MRFFPVLKLGESMRLFDALIPLLNEIEDPIRLVGAYECRLVIPCADYLQVSADDTAPEAHRRGSCSSYCPATRAHGRRSRGTP